MNRRLILNLTGAVLLVEAAMLLISFIVALIMRSGDHMALLASAGITLIVGGAMRHVKPKVDTLRARDGFLVVVLGWVLVSCFGALPFFIHGAIPNYIDALFETVSGFTTTGASILTDIEALPLGLHFWRSFTHWAGGMGVLVLSLAIMPKMGSRSIHLMRAESPGPSTDKMVPRIGNNAKILYTIYLSITGIMLVVMLLCGLNWYEALVHTFGAAGTGGFSIFADSIAHYSPHIQLIIGIFCMLFGVNFALYYSMLRGDFKSVWKNGELKLYISIIVVCTVLIALNILPLYDGKVGMALNHAYFQVSSVITTTGYATADFNMWPTLSKMLLVLLMFTGCCAGSTGGGIKLIRIEVLCKVMARELKRTVRPRSVGLIKVDGRVLEEETVNGVMAFFFVYMLVLIVSCVLVSFDSFVRDVSFEACFTGVVATLSNIGPGLGEVGPAGSFAEFTMFSKVIFTLDMLVGRLELFPLLMLLSPSAWRR
ncbi:MAG: TrkH family potassium uptake protein [Clostridia bacterium]|nr:TrkH family potassium uptake protein [Clostridia bacterium]